mmetsp:Transcript_10229/g.43047  ORF Transcript_10229/g.43047 Transcript_10229/m.43047 type:complete len:250 (-) Transcript_10229:379-1128(-)
MPKGTPRLAKAPSRARSPRRVARRGASRARSSRVSGAPTFLRSKRGEETPSRTTSWRTTSRRTTSRRSRVGARRLLRRKQKHGGTANRKGRRSARRTPPLSLVAARAVLSSWRRWRRSTVQPTAPRRARRRPRRARPTRAKSHPPTKKRGRFSPTEKRMPPKAEGKKKGPPLPLATFLWKKTPRCRRPRRRSGASRTRARRPRFAPRARNAVYRPSVLCPCASTRCLRRTASGWRASRRTSRRAASLAG